MTENELKQIVLRLARLNGWMVIHMTASPIRGSQGRGYPDLTLARDGEALWIELKQDDGIISSEQIAWSLALPAYHVIKPKDIEGRLVELLA